MELKLAEKVAMVVGAFTLFMMAYYVAIQAGGETKQAKYEGVRADPFVGLNAHILMTMHSGENQTHGHEWRRSDFDPSNEHLVMLPVRYPALSGQNCSAVMHHGWSALNRAAVADSDWIERPPGEVQW